MSTTNNTSSDKASTGSASPSPPPRRGGLTYEEGREQQGRILEEYYITDGPSEQVQDQSPPVAPKTVPSKRAKMNRAKVPATIDGIDGADDSPTPPKKTKPVSKRTMAASSSSDMDSTPTRRSERNKDKNKKRSATDDDDDVPESPLAKKTTNKKRSAPEDEDEPESAPAKKAKAVNATSSTATAEAAPSTSKPVAAAPMSKKKAGKLPATESVSTAPSTSKPVAAPMSKRKAGKLPVTEAEKPVSTRPTPMMKELKGKLPKTHTPSSELPNKKAKTKRTAAGDDETHAYDEDAMEAHNADDQTGGKKKAAMGKATKKVVIPHDYVGEETGMGTSANRPDLGPGANLALLDSPWPCANRQCNTGMTWLKRDGETAIDGFGRKTGSQFFGRNKAETKLMENDVWHTYCRKCYQRGYYARTNQKKEGEEFCNKPQEGAASWHMLNLRAQFQRLKLWRPEATFKVQLTKNMHARNNEWQASLRRNNDDVAMATAEYTKHARFGIKERKPAKNGEIAAPKPEEAFPVQLVDDFTGDCGGEGYDYDAIFVILDHIQAMLDAATISQVPPVEFLISSLAEGEETHDPKHNYRRWTAATDTRNFETPTTSGDEDGAGSDAGDADGETEADDNEDLHSVSDERTSPPTFGEIKDARHLFGQFETNPQNDEDSSDDSEEGDDDEDAAPPPRFNPINNRNRRDTQSSPGPSKPGKARPLSAFKFTPTASNPSGRPISTTFHATPGSGTKSEREKAEREQSGERVDAGSSNMNGTKRARDSEEGDNDGAGPSGKKLKW